MNAMRRFARSSFGSALLGGVVVGVLGWVAIAVGWITVPAEESDGEPALTALPATEPVGGSLSIAEIYDRTSQGVVHIRAGGGQAQPSSPFGPQGGGVATGSGFVIDEEGHIITNAHVVDDATEIDVTLGEGSDPIDAELVGSDPSTDIAVIKIDPAEGEFKPLELGQSDNVKVGDPVLAIGNPFGLDRTATAGIVSALQREIQAPDGFTIQEAIQTDAPINPGNSGGPLIDASGKVIGVNSQIEAAGSGGNIGIGFAVPINTAREIAQQLIENGEVQHAYLGISGADLTPAIAEALNLDVERGVLVQSVAEGSPADKAGLKAGDAAYESDGTRVIVGGDIIIAVDGKPVSSMNDVIAAIDDKKPGDKVELTVRRGDEEDTVEVTLDERPSQSP